MNEPAPSATVCPYCGYKADAASRVGGDRYVPPKVGDVALCIGCGGLTIWTAYGLRPPTKAETEELNQDATVRTLVAAWRAMGR